MLIAKKRVSLAGSGRYSRMNFGIETSNIRHFSVNRFVCDVHSGLFDCGICVSIHTGGLNLASIE